MNDNSNELRHFLAWLFRIFDWHQPRTLHHHHHHQELRCSSIKSTLGIQNQWFDISRLSSNLANTKIKSSSALSNLIEKKKIWKCSVQWRHKSGRNRLWTLNSALPSPTFDIKIKQLLSSYLFQTQRMCRQGVHLYFWIFWQQWNGNHGCNDVTKVAEIVSERPILRYRLRLSTLK